ncbi:sugar transferase [Salinicoccus roseus]|uniref:Sugar transferase n=1 Tax=Salinicoccus roseus TaxID=45670 RepID=A0A0C2E7Z3_9STAP|nr:sugar transferase [Salinicoccus roseus]KIH71407.1 sugar transferase [Salinicoccus roseus]MDB0579463.1 sugar transferase [Salinicoccus roseus]
MKRFFDVTAALGGLVILSPVMVVVALLIKWRMGGPVIFRQTRPGYRGRPFELYKFRTMTDQRDGEGNLLPDHMRMTMFGNRLRKYSLDELPQLFNVLKGDLSLVGPRPLMMGYLPLYNERQRRRHDVKPGITGWAQVNGRNALSWEEKFELDVWYAENRTLLLDMKILFMTIQKVLKSEGINQEGGRTDRAFTGTK